ncbi:MAG: hypothetical protein WBB76_03820 [Gaiellaceae bacterium]
MTEDVARPGQHSRRLQQPHLQLFVLGAAVAVAAIVVLWMVLVGGSGNTATPPSGGPTLVSQAQLKHLAGSVSYPVFWAGPKDGFSYELTTTHGQIFIRYLSAGVKAGDKRPKFLVVGTYARTNSFADLQRAAKRSGGVSFSLANGGLAVFNTKTPTSVYFSYPGAKYQVEVYSPSGADARSMVLAGKITPIR